MKKVLFKRIISTMVTIAMLITMVPATFASVEQFVDFPTGWSKEAMTFSVDNGLINGKSATKIEPRANLTRAEMATIINRAFGAEVTCDISQYTDVKTNDWFYTEMQKAVNMQTFQGDGDGTLRPNDSITREEVMTVIARAIVLESNDYSSINKFSDSSSISSWAKPFVSALIAGGYVDGYEDGTVRPGAKITREEFAQLMYNIFKTYITVSGTYNSVTNSDCVMINEGGVTLSDVTIDGDLVLGDGVSTDKIFLTNVTIKGRLVARGGVITLKNVTTGGGVVVKNVNGVTHFNNYRTESVFKGVIEHTRTTYLKTGSSSGSSGKTFDIEFFMYPENTAGCVSVGKLEGIEENTSVGYETDKTISNKVKNVYRNANPKRELWDPSVKTDITIEPKVYNHVDQGYVDGDYIHYIYPELIYKDADGKWQTFTGDTIITSDMKVYAVKKYAAITLDGKLGDYVDFGSLKPVLRTPYSSTTRAMDSLKDALYLSRNSFAQILTKETEEKLYAKIAPKAKIIDNNGYILIKDYHLKIADVISPADIEKEIRNYFADIIQQTPDEDEIKKFIDSFKRKDAICNINKDNVQFMIAVAKAIHDDYDVDEALALLNNPTINEMINKVPQIKEDIDEAYTAAKKEFLAGVEEINEKIKANDTYNEDCEMSLGMRINIANLLDKYYDKLQEALIERIKDKDPLYYSENKYLQDFVSINMFDMMIDYDSSKDESAIGGDNSGYHIRPFMEYYDTLYNNLLLFDKAVLWYGGHGHTPPITEGELKAIREDILADIVKAIDKLQSFLEDLDSGNEVVGGYTIDDIIDKVESLKNLSASSVNGMTSQITAMIDNICTILEKIDGGNVVAGGYTMDELAALCDKLEAAVEKLSDEDYKHVNKKLSSAINKVVTKADEIIKELDATGTILGKVSLDELFAKVDFINNIYLKYEDEIDKFINKLATDGTIGDIGSDIKDNVDSEYWEDIIFGNDDYNRFNLDSIFDFIAPHLDDIRVDKPDNWYDENAKGNMRSVIDEYRISAKDASITIDRYFQ